MLTLSNLLLEQSAQRPDFLTLKPLMRETCRKLHVRPGGRTVLGLLLALPAV